jgi:hypothetical protein
MLKGLPFLRELNLHGNKISEIRVPGDPEALSRLEFLDVSSNDLTYLPTNLNQLTSLRRLDVASNLLEVIPFQICEMNLTSLDISSNPILQPPVETCERGICSMRRFYRCIQEETTNCGCSDEISQRVLTKHGRPSSRPAPVKESELLEASLLCSSGRSLCSYDEPRRACSIIFPERQHDADQTSSRKLREIIHRLHQCEVMRWPRKKKLMLDNMYLTAADIPSSLIVGSTLGNTLHKLSLSGNRLRSIPSELLQRLPQLQTLDLSKCELLTLPALWNLPQLTTLDLSFNKLVDFPEEVNCCKKVKVSSFLILC